MCVLSCGVPGVLLQSPPVLACVFSDPYTHTHTQAQTHTHTLPDPSLIHWLTFDPQCCSVDQTYPKPTETTIQHCGATSHSTVDDAGERGAGGDGQEEKEEREKVQQM